MTRNLRAQLAADAERWIRAWSRPDVSREDAAVMVTYWHLYEPTDPELVEEVLSRFSPAEPPAVPFVDFLPVAVDAFADEVGKDLAALGDALAPVKADAAVIVAESVAEFTPRQYRDRDGDLWHEYPRGEVKCIEKDGDSTIFPQKIPFYLADREYGPLVEVQSTAEPLTGEVVSPFGPCSGLAADKRTNTCTRFAAEYVSYQSESWSGMTCRRLCTSCANAAPDVYSRTPLTHGPGGVPVAPATQVVDRG